MSESLRKKLIFMTLPLALLYAAYSLQSKKPSAKAADSTYATIQPITAAGIGASAAAPEKVDRQAMLAAPWGRDPFRFGSRPLARTVTQTTTTSPKQKPLAAPVNWEVSGILYSDTHPIAYVNRKAVTIGQSVDDAKVIAISKSSVTLEYAGKQITVSPR